MAHIKKTLQAKGVITFSLPENLPVQLPLQTSEKDLLERFIRDETNFSNLVNIEYIIYSILFILLYIYL